ncbi:MAG: transposase [Gammaproteobacteria bacterium]|nr:transposase [Gammaproteobacteria bacterium]
MGKSRYKIVTDEKTPYFLTCAVVNWLPLFANPVIAQVVIDSLRYLQEQQRIELHAYVMMENHLHLIVSAVELSREIGAFKSFTARSAIDWYQANDSQWVLKQLHFYKEQHKCDQEFQFWQEGNHPQWIKDEAMLLNKLEYIHHNPVKRGYVDDPIHWRYSSYRNYMGWDECLLPIVKLA